MECIIQKSGYVSIVVSGSECVASNIAPCYIIAPSVQMGIDGMIKALAYLEQYKLDYPQETQTDGQQ